VDQTESMAINSERLAVDQTESMAINSERPAVDQTESTAMNSKEAAEDQTESTVRIPGRSMVDHAVYGDESWKRSYGRPDRVYDNEKREVHHS
jgi:hypothetical protein